MKKKVGLGVILTLASSSLFGLVSCSNNETMKVYEAKELVEENASDASAKIEVSGPNTIKEGESAQLIAKISNFKDGVLTWTSSNPEIIKVDEKGFINALDGGEATISVALGKDENNVEAKAEFKVTSIAKEEQVFRVKYVDYDGTLLYETFVNFGEDAPFVGQDPKRSADYKNAYVFKGWDQEAKNVSSDLIITAQYETRDISDYIFVRNSGENTYRLYYYLGKETEITIPDTYNNLPVTAIDSSAFEMAEIKKVTLSNSIGVISDGAFKRLETLEEIVIPSSVYEFGTGVFEDCTNLVKVTLPDSLREIPDDTFNGCTSLTTVNIPANVARVGENAFRDCESLSEIALPDKVSSIGKNAFDNTKIKNFTLPKECETLGDYCFQDCVELESVNWNDICTTVSKSCFDGCLKLTKFNFKPCITTLLDAAFRECGFTSIDVPNTVTSIGAHAFRDNVNLESVNLMANITEVPRSCFFGDVKLKSINYSETITSLGSNCFQDCGLTTLDQSILSENITEISNYAFSGSSLSGEITIPNWVTSIGNYSFSSCENMTKLIVSEGVNTIGTSAFSSCINLSEVSLPSTLVEIGAGAFSGCNISSFNISESNKDFAVENGALFDRNKTELLFYPTGSTQGDYKVPETVKTISDQSFAGATNLLSIDLSNVETIGNKSFSKSGITELQLPNTIIDDGLDSYALSEMTSLKSVVINSDNLKALNGYTFNSDTVLESVTFNCDLEKLGNNEFYNCMNLKVVTLPASLKSIGRSCFLSTPNTLVIKYLGTKKQWNAINLSSAGFESGTTVECSDGTITL